MREDRVANLILQAMKVTKEHLADDFKLSISKTNENGLNHNVWARRSDELESYFKNDDDIIVLHIKRSSLWQIDPVFDKKTGILYVQFTDKTLESILRKFKKEKDITHYIFSLLLKVSGKLPLSGEQMEFALDDNVIEKRDERRKQDNSKMLGVLESDVKDIKIISVTYHENLAIYAQMIEYTSNFELSRERDISNLLPLVFEYDDATITSSSNNDNFKDDQDDLIVKLK